MYHKLMLTFSTFCNCEFGASGKKCGYIICVSGSSITLIYKGSSEGEYTVDKRVSSKFGSHLHNTHARSEQI